MRHDRVLLRLPDTPSTLEFRPYRDAVDRGDACDAPPSDASLLATFDAEVAAALPLTRRTYGLDHADYSATATVTGRDGSVHAS